MGRGILQGAFAGGQQGRAQRAPAAPGQGILLVLTHATVALAFYPRHLSGLSVSCFSCYRGGHAPLKPASRHHARSLRGCLIANPTIPSNGNQGLQNQPVFSCVPSAASVSTRINTRYQADNRCRQRHRVRKAVFVQLVGICSKAFAHVLRSG